MFVHIRVACGHMAISATAAMMQEAAKREIGRHA